DGYLSAVNWLQANVGDAGRVAIGSTGPGNEAGLVFGASLDTNIYRAAAGIAKTPGLAVGMGADLTAAASITVTASAHRFTAGGGATITTITWTGVVAGTLLMLINRAGSLINLGTGGNVLVGGSLAVGAAKLLIWDGTGWAFPS